MDDELVPDAMDDIIAVSADESFGDTDGDVLANDFNPGPDPLTVDEVAGDPASVGATVAGSDGGAAVINADGTIDFSAEGDFDDLGRGETRTTTFTYGIDIVGLAETADIMLLHDLSGSFDDDPPNVRAQFGGLYAALNQGGRDVDFGVASFIDKPVPPFGAPGDYVYNTDLAVSGDQAAIQAALDALVVGFGDDEPESQLEALLQLALRAETEAGFRADTQRLVVVSTDAPPHVAGDYPTAPEGPNDADDVIEDENYPSVEQVREALEAAEITPIFSVTSDQVAAYEALVAELGRGVVVEISPDSDDLADAVVAALEEVETVDTATVTVTVEGVGKDGECKEIDLKRPSEKVTYKGDKLVVHDFDTFDDTRAEKTSDTLRFNFEGAKTKLNSVDEFLDFVKRIETDADQGTDAVFNREHDLTLIFDRHDDGSVKKAVVLDGVIGRDKLTIERLAFCGADAANSEPGKIDEVCSYNGDDCLCLV